PALMLAFAPMGAAKASMSKSPPLAPPPMPPLRQLKLEPASLVLEDGRDVHKVLVLGETENRQEIDLTGQAVFKSDTAAVEIDADGYLHGAARGQARVTVSAAGMQAVLPVTVKDAAVPPVRFVRDIEPVISRIGCNAGTCHGSARGKNGFKLSLRGYDPEYDYQALIDDDAGRRFNRVAVEQSLMLLKPTAEVPHEGRQVLQPGSRYYHLIHDWIAQGTRLDEVRTGRANAIEVLPADIELDLPGRSQQMVVLAHYADGAVRDVTREAILTSNNADVSEVKGNTVTAVRRGEAAVLVRYEGNYATKLVTVMGDRTGFVWAPAPEYNYIDRFMNAKWEKVKTLPSGLCTDAEFLRRVSLDLTGLPPTPDRVRQFLADPTPSREKRQRLVDELIGNADYVEYWANRWADLLQCSSATLGEKGVWVFHNWIRDCVARNLPYDQFVRALLLAEGSSYRNPAVNYYRVLRDPNKITEDVTQTFLGVRFNCAKCHDHPFEKWTQNQYYELGAYFARVAIKRGTLGKDTVRSFTGDPITVTGEEIVYLNYAGGEVRHPKTDKVVAAEVPYGEAQDTAAAGDRRLGFVNWLTAKDNPLFAKSMANRLWSYCFGRGIIDPVDDIRASNPPSNPALLDALTKDFVESGFNVRHLLRTICLSHTYQLSFHRNPWNQDDTVNFSHAAPRRLSAEQLMDAVAVATGTRPKLKGLPKGALAVDAPDGEVPGDDFLELFGRPKRQSACECERTSNISLSHAMNLINGATIDDAVAASDNRIAKLVATEQDDHKVVQDIYLACLGRLPTDRELTSIHLAGGTSRLEAAQDLTWALINSPAFLFNR
ncbi:MAG: DUF1553 domain-containing protein, partial [Verrucomicrobia bacterium]|nr:DUF1553 domain-containing protein [Verrucomicrobiota bacterium]